MDSRERKGERVEKQNREEMEGREQREREFAPFLHHSRD